MSSSTASQQAEAQCESLWFIGETGVYELATKCRPKLWIELARFK